MLYLQLINLILWAGVFAKIDINNKKQIERELLLKKWLFESLYSINSKVILPTEHKKPLGQKKAHVYNPASNPYNEFKKDEDIYHE